MTYDIYCKNIPIPFILAYQSLVFGGDRGGTDRLQPRNVIPPDGTAQMVSAYEFNESCKAVCLPILYYVPGELDQIIARWGMDEYAKRKAHMNYLMFFLLQWLVQITCGNDACTMIMNVFGYTAMGQVTEWRAWKMLLLVFHPYPFFRQIYW
ncbi:hypothetical protein OSTOST_00385 [Ostertagia ostertagi]